MEMNLHSFFLRYPKVTPLILSISFVCGFLFDIYTLPSVTSVFYPFIGIGYASLVGAGILFIVFRGDSPLVQKIRIIVSFFFGSLLSYLLVYYGRGGSFVLHYPLFIFLGSGLLFHEISKDQDIKVFLEIVLYIVSLYLLTIFNYPLLEGAVNNKTFFLSVVCGFGLSLAFFLTICLSSFGKKYKIFLGVFLCIFPALLMYAYNKNLIPAVPLTLGESGIYKKVEKRGDQYVFLSLEKFTAHPFAFWKPDEAVMEKGGVIYFYGALLTPAPIQTEISHIYEKYNEKNKLWERKAVIPYPISGGREKGYRGYSAKTITEEGLWRVRVATDEKRSVGLKEILISFQ